VIVRVFRLDRLARKSEGRIDGKSLPENTPIAALEGGEANTWIGLPMIETERIGAFDTPQ